MTRRSVYTFTLAVPANTKCGRTVTIPRASMLNLPATYWRMIGTVSSPSKSAVADKIVTSVFSCLERGATSSEIFETVKSLLNPDKEREIIGEIYRAFVLLGVESDLLGTIGSWRDSLSDDEVAAGLKTWNEDRLQKLKSRVEHYRTSKP